MSLICHSHVVMMILSTKFYIREEAMEKVINLEAEILVREVKKALEEAGLE